MNWINIWVLVICLLSIIANAMLVALSLKLYTEYFKDKSIAARAEKEKS
jgi:hypothetical protein